MHFISNLYLFLANHAIVDWFIRPPPVESYWNAAFLRKYAHLSRNAQGVHHGSLHGLIEVYVCNSDVSCHVPG